MLLSCEEATTICHYGKPFRLTHSRAMHGICVTSTLIQQYRYDTAHRRTWPSSQTITYALRLEGTTAGTQASHIWPSSQAIMYVFHIAGTIVGTQASHL